MKSDSQYLIPGAIVIAGLAIAGAVYFSNRNSSNPPPSTNQPITTTAAENIKPVTSVDHILGNPDAPVKIVEFSDLECPVCKAFHPIMQPLMSEYGKQGKVAWVYRHFPLNIHPKSPNESEASECAAELGGEIKFWAYIDKIFEITPSNNGLDPAMLPKVAEEIGLDKKSFQDCLSSHRYSEKVTGQYQDAINSGAGGTPYAVVIAANGKKFVINGMSRTNPYGALKSVVDAALAEK